METQTKPCEACGIPVTKTRQQQARRLYWTCGKKCSVLCALRSGNRVGQSNRFSGQRETRLCTQCARPTTRYLTEQNNDQAWFCSRTCSALHQTGKPQLRTGDEVSCVVCGEMFYRQPAQIQRNQAACSAYCGHRSKAVQKIERACDWCGKPVLVYPAQGASRRFCSTACSCLGRIKCPGGRMHNGKPVRGTGDGYILIWEPTHPKNRRGWILEHRWLMEQKLGRLLVEGEEIDHKNAVRDDNREENLQVLGKADHRKKTGSDARLHRATTKAELEAVRARLAAYEAKYGPLE